MAKPELGTKRNCPETGRNFYDLNKDPVVSPYTEKEYPLSFFVVEAELKKPKPVEKKPPEPAQAAPEVENEEEADNDDAGPQIISLEDVDEGADDDADDDVDDEDAETIADIPNVDIDDVDDDDAKPDDDTFLEEDDDDTDLAVVIGTRGNDGKEDT